MITVICSRGILAALDGETAERRRQLRDEVLTFIIAGHETTAIALSWTWYLLSENPEAERRLHAEVDEVLEGRSVSLNDLPNLKYTSMVINEAMRLYPPVWAMRREAIGDDEIMGFDLPRGYNVMLSQWLTHRHPDLWTNPDRFEPERFLPERCADLPRYAFFPFGGGPRACIANWFVPSEAQIVLATVAQKCRLRMVPHHPMVLDPWLTLRPRHGLKVVLEPRGN